MQNLTLINSGASASEFFALLPTHPGGARRSTSMPGDTSLSEAAFAASDS